MQAWRQSWPTGLHQHHVTSMHTPVGLQLPVRERFSMIALILLLTASLQQGHHANKFLSAVLHN